jgi:hypothetical protein
MYHTTHDQIWSTKSTWTFQNQVCHTNPSRHYTSMETPHPESFWLTRKIGQVKSYPSWGPLPNLPGVCSWWSLIIPSPSNYPWQQQDILVYHPTGPQEIRISFSPSFLFFLLHPLQETLILFLQLIYTNSQTLLIHLIYVYLFIHFLLSHSRTTPSCLPFSNLNKPKLSWDWRQDTSRKTTGIPQ